MDKFLIVDGNSLANRAFYAMPFLTSPDGNPCGAVFGVANLIIKAIEEVKPRYVAVAFDHARRTFRNEIFDKYKGTRKETPEDLLLQFPIIRKMLVAMGIKYYEQSGIEADDIIGSISKASVGTFNIILSGDKDLLQLVDDTTNVYLTKKGVTDVEVVDVNRLKESFGLTARQVIELKGLMGDKSDNIPGVSGIGETTAKKLLNDYGDIDNIYLHIDEVQGKLKDKLILGKSDAYMSKDLATIRRDFDVGFDLAECQFSLPLSGEAYQFFKTYSFNTILNRSYLFSSTKEEEQVVVTISSIEQFKEKIEKIGNFLSINLKKGEFSIKDGEILKISTQTSLFEFGIGEEVILETLRPYIEDESIEKITIDSKYDMKLFLDAEINYANYFDISLAHYLTTVGKNIKLDNLLTSEYFAYFKKLKTELVQMNLEKVYSEIEVPLTKVLCSMEKEGFKIDTKILDEQDEIMSQEIAKLRSQIFMLAGCEFNINSPKQVADVLYNKLGLSTWNNTKKNSTSADVLEELAPRHEIAEKILLYRKYSKLKNTYIDVYKLLVRTSGDVIHTVFNQTLTNTGRLSSSEPNLQNIPKRTDLGKQIRQIFISKFVGGKIISADYNQIELRLLASMSNEELLINAYNNGEDIHTRTASEIFGVSPDLVTEEMRRDAKAVNFGIIYGISDFGLSQSIKSSRKIAKEYIDNYFARYPNIKSYMKSNVDFAKENGFVQTLFGRRRYIPELTSSSYQSKSFGERVAMNMPLQGTASDIIKLAMIKVYEKLKGKRSKLILQIHDELIVDTHPEEVDEVKQILKECMEKVIKLKVPLLVKIEVGEHL